MSPSGSPIMVSPLANPNPCKSPNAKATTQGWRMVRLALAALISNDLRTEKENARALSRLPRAARGARVAQGRHRERQAVRDRERGDRLQQHPSIRHEKEEAEDEQQMVDAEQDVFHTHAEVRSPPRASRQAQPARRTTGRPASGGRLGDRPSRLLKPHQHVRR